MKPEEVIKGQSVVLIHNGEPGIVEYIPPLLVNTGALVGIRMATGKLLWFHPESLRLNGIAYAQVIDNQQK